ncbi:MAG: hypothetical protein ACI9OJ_001833 [Myxococcota bacterium]|jgi:hypothetical protein
MQSSYPIELLENNSDLPSQEQVLERFRRRVIDRASDPDAENDTQTEAPMEAAADATAAEGVVGDSSDDENGPEDMLDAGAEELEAGADEDDSEAQWDEDTNVELAAEATDDPVVEEEEP